MNWGFAELLQPPDILNTHSDPVVSHSGWLRLHRYQGFFLQFSLEKKLCFSNDYKLNRYLFIDHLYFLSFSYPVFVRMFIPT